MERSLILAFDTKRGSESTNNLDRISQLPEDLILQILCLLPAKVAIATSVLSKQWQSHWEIMPKLKFDCIGHRLELANVCSYVLSHKAPVLQSLHLSFHLYGRNNTMDIGIVIGIAMTRNARKLVLEDYFHYGFFRFPRCFYNCETLETLTLNINVVLDVPSSVCLKSLRSLHLQTVNFKDDESVLNLLSGCPNLQDLVLHRHPRSYVKTITIAMPSLQRLSIHNPLRGITHWSYVINTPSLKYLKIRALASCLIENIPELVEAYIINVPETLTEKVMVSLISAKRLSLALLPFLKFKFPTSIIFYQLVYLELFTKNKVWWDLLTLMLHSSPKLQVLKLIVVSNVHDLGVMNNVEEASGEWNEPKNVPECLLSHLETFMWKGYKWKREDEREVAKYILKNTNRLKRATFSSNSISYEDKLVVVKDLKSVVRATNSCKFQFI